MSARSGASGAGAIIELGAIEVVFVSGERGLPIPQQASYAFSALEALLPSLKKKRFYGVVIDGQYRACVAIDDDTRELDCRIGCSREDAISCGRSLTGSTPRA